METFARAQVRHYDGKMSPNGLAIFVFFAFLLPVPLLTWLDKPRQGKE
jgi:hypothetical protein